jgi:hypothetical protein
MTILYSILALMFFSIVAAVVLPILVAISVVYVAGLVIRLSKWKIKIAPLPELRRFSLEEKI